MSIAHALPPLEQSENNWTWLEGLLAVMLVGYMSMSRTFSHIGISPIYLSEIVLAIFIFTRPRVLVFPWIGNLVKSQPLSLLSWTVFLSIALGVLQCVRGIGLGYDKATVIKCLVFNLYLLFLFLGIWIGKRHPEFLPRLIRFLGWFHGIYGVLHLTLFAFLGLTDPVGHAAVVEDDPISWSGQPRGSAIILLGLLAFEKDQKRNWIPILLNSFVLLGVQVRAEWLACVVGVFLLSLLTGKLKQLAKVGVAVALLLLAGLLVDFRIPATHMRGGEFSVRGLASRGLAAVAPDLAAELVPNIENFSGTVTWRTRWWAEIWDMVHETPVRAVFGPGYGYPILDLHPEEMGAGSLRTPHNGYLFCLAYTGWSGIFVMLAVQLSVAALLWCVYRQTGQPFGVCFWLMILVWAFFDNLLENPHGAIPLYLIAGMVIGSHFDGIRNRTSR
jgi:hypothetical protein